MVFVTLAQEDQVMIIDTEEDELYEDALIVKSDSTYDINYFVSKNKIINQREILPNCYLLASTQMRTFFGCLFLKIVFIPKAAHFFFTQWKKCIENDLIILN